MSEAIIAVDLGGTRIRAARFDRELTLEARQETLTLAHEGLIPTLERIKGLIRAVLPPQGRPVDGIGICIPGPVNPRTGIVELGTNLAGWQDVPLKKILEDAFDLPVYLGNDANVAALAEVAAGAARGYRHVIYITISTGIGGGVITDGLLLLGRDGYAAEVGHMVLVVNGRVSSLEKEAAGPALARQARARLEAGETSLMTGLVDGDLSRISGGTVGRAALQGDALALDIASTAGRIVGLGIVNLLHSFNPEIIVLGGSVTFGLGDLLMKPLWEAVRQHSIAPGYWEDLKIVQAGLGDDVSLYGTGALVVTEGGVKEVGSMLRKLDAE